jgi:hypothetical protein
MTKELAQQFKKIGSQRNVEDPIVVAKFFDPTGGATWYCTEYDPKHREFYGFASVFNDHNDEWGWTSLDELREVKGRFGLGIERDLNFGQKPISLVCPKAVRKFERGDESGIGENGVCELYEETG